jgi:hypothetical protein
MPFRCCRSSSGSSRSPRLSHPGIAVNDRTDAAGAPGGSHRDSGSRRSEELERAVGQAIDLGLPEPEGARPGSGRRTPRERRGDERQRTLSSADNWGHRLVTWNVSAIPARGDGCRRAALRAVPTSIRKVHILETCRAPCCRRQRSALPEMREAQAPAARRLNRSSRPRVALRTSCGMACQRR